MIFVGPMMVITLSVTGWIAMIGAMPISITYIVKSAKEGANGKFISIAAAIAQVFFTFDVISIMILAIKERKCIKAITVLRKQNHSHSSLGSWSLIVLMATLCAP